MSSFWASAQCPRNRHNNGELENFNVGYLVEFDRGHGNHWGVLIGDEEVVHLSGPEDHRDSIAGSGASECHPRSSSEIEARFGKYTCNSEHFSSRCRYGEKRSDHGISVLAFLSGTALVVGALYKLAQAVLRDDKK